MSSKRLYLCRHADYIKTNTFPSGIVTPEGFGKAVTLGRYLRKIWQVDPNDVGLICSTSSRSEYTGYATAQGIGMRINMGENFFTSSRFKEVGDNISSDKLKIVMSALEVVLNNMTMSTAVALFHGGTNKGILKDLNSEYQQIMGKCGMYVLEFTGGKWIDTEFYCNNEAMKTRLESMVVK